MDSARVLIARGWGVSFVSRCLRVSRAQLHVILRRTDDWKDGRRSRGTDDTDALARISIVSGGTLLIQRRAGVRVIATREPSKRHLGGSLAALRHWIMSRILRIQPRTSPSGSRSWIMGRSHQRESPFRQSGLGGVIFHHTVKALSQRIGFCKHFWCCLTSDGMVGNRDCHSKGFINGIGMKITFDFMF